MPKQKRKINPKAVFAIYWRHTKKHPWLLLAAVAGVILSQVSNIVGPIYIKDILNLLIQNGTVTHPELIHLLELYVGVSLIGWAGGRSEMLFGYTMISKVCAALSKEAFENLMLHSYKFFTNSFAGALTRRVSRFAASYENLYYSMISVMLEAVIYIAGITGVLMYRNTLIGLIVLAWVILFTLLQWRMSGWQRPLRLKRAEEDSNFTATLADSISNQNTVALFSGNAYENRLVGVAADTFQKAQLKSWNFNSLIYGIQGLLSIGLNVVVLWLAVALVERGILSFGDLLLVQVYVFGIFGTVWNLGRQFQVVHNSLADASEMVETMTAPHDIKDLPDAKKFKTIKAVIEFKNVSFHYGGEPVLKDLTLTIPGGQKVALVGPSGAGKSTITKLLLRLFDVKSGAISIDGQNIAAVTQDSLRNAIAFVPQEPILFHRSLMENIRYGRRDATDQEVLAAARQAHCHEFIDKLPLKYETFVGERGIKLSGGERQRVAIARAILKNAPILVLDEATSSLDSESEALIQDALATLMQGKTVVVIAHRLSTIMKMDRILVLEGGRVVADGTHSELLAQGGLYHKLWSIQAGGFIGGTPAAAEEEEPTDELETDELAAADEEK